MSNSPVSLATHPVAPAFLTSPVNELLVGLALFVAACLSMWLTFVPSGISLIWPGPAIAAALLIRMRTVRWRLAVGSIFLAVILANVLMVHRPWADAAVLAGLTVFEITLMVGTFRFVWVFPYPNITITHAGVMTAIFGIAIPGMAALAGAAFIHLRSGAPFASFVLQLWSSHAIGACLLGPPIILFSIKGCKRLVAKAFFLQNALAVLGCLIGCYLAVRFVRFPFVVIGLLLMIAAFRMGGLGASLLSVAIGLIITNLWILGVRPIGLESFASVGTLVGFPVIALLATVMPPIAVGLGSDARRAAARALKVSERRFRESMEHSPIGMLISDLNGVWGYTNLALQQMLGYSAEEFQALPAGGPSKPEDWKESASRWKRLLSGEVRAYDVTRQFQRKDGRWVWTHVAVSIARDEEGSPLHLISQIESLEARKQAEEKLAAAGERLNITLKCIKDAVITTDATTQITYMNASAEALMGLELKAVEGRRMDEVIHLMDPQTSKSAANLIGQSALHAKVFEREQACLLHRSDGSICYVTDVVSPLLDSGGALTGLVIVFHDATLEVDRARDLQHRALHDPLTNLSNRADFGQRLRTAFSKARQLNRNAALLAIDLDRFKAVNDAVGHAAGDALLCKVAEVCQATVRSSDAVARLGGDEFAIILENCAEERARRIGNQLLRALNTLELEWLGSHYSIGASIGLAMCTMNMKDEKGWLEAADAACYLAKRQGRGQLRGAEPQENNVILLKQR